MFLSFFENFEMWARVLGMQFLWIFMWEFKVEINSNFQKINGFFKKKLKNGPNIKTLQIMLR